MSTTRLLYLFFLLFILFLCYGRFYKTTNDDSQDKQQQKRHISSPYEDAFTRTVDSSSMYAMPDGAPLHEPIPLSDTAPMSASADLTPSSAEASMSEAADYDYAQGQYATTAAHVQASYTQESIDESFNQPSAISNALKSAKRLRRKDATQQPRTKAPQPQQTTRSSSSPQSSTHSSPPSLSKWIKSALGKCHISAASSGVKSSLENAHELAKGNLTAFAHKVLTSTTISVAVSTAISLFKRMLYPLLGYSIASSCLFGTKWQPGQIGFLSFFALLLLSPIQTHTHTHLKREDAGLPNFYPFCPLHTYRRSRSQDLRCHVWQDWKHRHHQDIFQVSCCFKKK